MKKNKRKRADEPAGEADIDSEHTSSPDSDAEKEALPRSSTDKSATDPAEPLQILTRDDPPGWPEL